MFKFCQKLCVHPCSSLAAFAWFPAHWAVWFLSLEEVILQNQPPSLHLLSLQAHIYGFLWSRTLDRLNSALLKPRHTILQSAMFPWPWLCLKAWFCDFPGLSISSINTLASICGERARLRVLIWTGDFLYLEFIPWVNQTGQVWIGGRCFCRKVYFLLSCS